MVSDFRTVNDEYIALIRNDERTYFGRKAV